MIEISGYETHSQVYRKCHTYTMCKCRYAFGKCGLLFICSYVFAHQKRIWRIRAGFNLLPRDAMFGRLVNGSTGAFSGWRIALLSIYG